MKAENLSNAHYINNEMKELQRQKVYWKVAPGLV